eukprot:TRINITY_DN5355_c0_g1_i2.p1 TRINITY_DN5355_c0_g1~~TRINITY_DN5355_c0_g1_i2.p1  ORF type:complete len:288 (-),score=65.89 TRINITY_DN5355_c0_g1_i2:108-971(-)
MGDRVVLRSKWMKAFEESIESDSWGQVVESTEGYEKLISWISKEQLNSQLSDDERSLLAKLKLCLTLRIMALTKKVNDPLTVDELKKLRPIFESLFTANKLPFPIALARYKDGVVDDVVTASLVPAAPQPKKGGTLLPPPPPSLDGGAHLTIQIEKIGLKDATEYLDPFITVSVLDSLGLPLEPSQDTPSMNQKRDTYVYFGCNVEIQTQVNKLPHGSAIVFEFKHFKPKGDYISTKCWAFMELDEIKPGPVVLEIYAKPTDVRRKKVKLLSIKPLYLHLNLKETVL